MFLYLDPLYFDAHFRKAVKFGRTELSQKNSQKLEHKIRKKVLAFTLLRSRSHILRSHQPHVESLFQYGAEVQKYTRI